MKALLVGMALLCAGLVLAGEGTSSPRAWVAFGRVTDTEGQGMSGVKLWACAGNKTLLPTGETTTDADGTYRLAFGSGWVRRDKSGQVDASLAPPQVAIISPHKEGYYERNLYRHGVLRIAGSVPTGRFAKESPPAETVLPNQPVRIDFVMLPAAAIAGRVTDGKGKPVTDQKFLLGGDRMPPGAEVLCSCEPDQDGRFTATGVPLGSYWFTPANGKLRGLRSNGITFGESGRYEVDLTFDPGKKELAARVTATPGSAMTPAKIDVPNSAKGEGKE